MTKEARRLTRIETYSGSMVLFIGIFYLLSVGSSFFQTGFIHKTRLLGAVELKMLLLSVLYVSGSILLFLRKGAGWIICAATLLNYLWLVLVYILTIARAGSFNSFAGMAIAFFILLLLALLFIFSGQTRRNFMVNNKIYLFTIVLCVLLGIAIFAV